MLIASEIKIGCESSIDEMSLNARLEYLSLSEITLRAISNISNISEYYLL